MSGEHAVSRRHHARDVAPGILPCALRASLRLSKIAPGDFVEPEDFIARLAALVPKPRAHLTRYHGVFAPASRDRARIVPGTRAAASAERAAVSVSDRQRAMSWAQRLKRVFAIDIDKSAGSPICTAEGSREAVGHRDVPDETCQQCGARLRVIASIEQPAVIERILEHLGHTAEIVDPAHSTQPSRASPQGDRLV